MATSSHRSGSRRWTFRGLAVALGILPLLVLELVLGWLDLGDPDVVDDPLSGFSRIRPLFEPDARAGVYRTSGVHGLFFGTQEFQIQKPRRGLRVFCLGGSTVRGRPFTTESSFTRWLELELSQRCRQRTVEVVNCGGISYASYRLRPILKEVLHYQPDLVVVATGHNEFLEDRSYRGLKDRGVVRAWFEERLLRLRSVTLGRSLLGRDSPAEYAPEPSYVEARLDQQSGYASYHRDPAWQAEVVAEYEASLRVMVAACDEAGVPLLLVRLGCNLRDCPPFKSEHREGLSPEDESRWQRAFDEGGRAQERGEYERALAAYVRAETIDDQFALLAWRIARSRDRLGGGSGDLEAYYGRARELDICPLRMIDAIDRRLQRVARETSTRLVDAKTDFEQADRSGVPGFNWYSDHVHPTIYGHQRIASLIAGALEQEGLVRLEPAGSPEQWRQLCRGHFQSLGTAFFSNGARRVAWLENWARRHRLDSEVEPLVWGEHARAGYRLIDFGDHQAAWRRYRAAVDASPHPLFAVSEILRHAGWLFAQGRPDDAKFLVDQLGRLAETNETREAKVAQTVGWAGLVLAVAAADRDRAAGLLEKFGTTWETERIPDVGWRPLMPNALARARALVR